VLCTIVGLCLWIMRGDKASQKDIHTRSDFGLFRARWKLRSQSAYVIPIVEPLADKDKNGSFYLWSHTKKF
jgi:hypothetical protein